MSISFPDEIAGFRFLPVEFDKKVRLVDEAQAEAVIDHVSQEEVTDLLVLSHGWNNDESQALGLYQGLLKNIAARAGGRLDDRNVAALGVFWPSKKFADEDLIPGGAASFDTDLPPDALVAEIEALRGFFDEDDADDALDALIALVPNLDGDAQAQQQFGDLVRSLLGTDAKDDAEVGDEIPAGFFDMPGDELLDELSVPRDEEMGVGGAGAGGAAKIGDVDAGVGDPTGGAAGLGDIFSGIRSGAGSALNLITYWKMKARAGKVGRGGLAPLLRSLRTAAPEVRIHLVGHSFGGRLVSAAALGEDQNDPALPVGSMTLLQAAFSHHGFAVDWEPDKDGYFRNVYSQSRVSGPTLVTYTANDRANRWAYPMASRLARQKAAAFGDATDDYGAIGANGAQKTPEAIAGTLLPVNGSYSFEPGKLHNLNSSDFISDHGDVTGSEVAHAVVSAIVSAY